MAVVASQIEGNRNVGVREQDLVDAAAQVGFSIRIHHSSCVVPLRRVASITQAMVPEQLDTSLGLGKRESELCAFDRVGAAQASGLSVVRSGLINGLRK